jgi:hypothetical protein
MYHRRKTIKMRQEEEQMMLAQDKAKMMQWRHKPKQNLIRKLTLRKKKIDLQYMGQLAQIDIMKAKALMDMNMPKE